MEDKNNLGLSFDGIVLNNGKYANVDGLWGPYESEPEAVNTIKAAFRYVGKKFGVKVYSDNVVVGVKEYIWTGTGNNDYKELALIKDDLDISSDASEITYTPTGGTQTYVASKLDDLDSAVSGIQSQVDTFVVCKEEGNTTQFLRSGGTGDAVWDNIDGNDVTINVENLDHFNDSGSATPKTYDYLQNVIDEVDRNIGNLESDGVKVNVDLNEDTLPYKFEIKNHNGTVVGTITYSRDSVTNLLKLNFEKEGGDAFDINVPNLQYVQSNQMLQYWNGSNWEDIVKISNLQIKDVVSEEPNYSAQIQEGTSPYIKGDLILVETTTSGTYNLEVCINATYMSGDGRYQYSWQNLGPITSVSLQAANINYSHTQSELTATTVQGAIDEITENVPFYETVTAENQITNLDDPTFS